MKRNKRVDAARDEAATAAGSWSQTATEKILPLAQTAAGMAVPLAHSAAGRVVPLAQTAAAMAVPLAQNAAAKAGPYAGRAAERLAPLTAGGALAAHEAAERVGPVLSEAYTLVGEAYAKLGEAYTKVGPTLGDAYGKVGPAFEAARDHVSDDLLPKVTTALGTAAASPVAVEAVKRGRATVAAARGELSLPEPAPLPALRGGSWVKRAAVIAAVAGVVTLVARRFLGSSSKDSGWQAARPSAPVAPTTASSTSTTTTPVAPASYVGSDADADATVETTSRYGEGAYVGQEPPEGYVIKGNENSMTYHLPDGSGYFGTQAEVWFVSEEAAERAGFVRAQE